MTKDLANLLCTHLSESFVGENKRGFVHLRSNCQMQSETQES